jgi:hypothetical protein
MAEILDSVVNLLDFADELSASNPKFTIQNLKCREEFLAFIRINEYFGIPLLNDLSGTEDTGAFLINWEDAAKIRPNLELWLRSYGTDSDEKLGLLTERMIELHPQTGALFADFLEHSEADSNAAWKLADYLCFILRSEISSMSEKELHRLAADMDRELPLNSARLFSGFLLFARERGQLKAGWVYQFNSRVEAGAVEAYGTPDFLKMAYIVFNEDAWEKERLLKKALQSDKHANLWLFVALHFICGWRGTDLVRLPMPKLPCDGKTIREQIAVGGFDTEGIITELEFRLRFVSLKPQKTQAYENVPGLKLFVPESLRKPIGIILAIAASRNESVKPGGYFLRKAGETKSQIHSFFGKDFATACGGRGFHSRRANKAYLQGIEMLANDSPGRPKGYMLAALARSHKGGFGTLPNTTDIYLRDAKFSGYRPEFIAKEMFERGVFSFIPSLMMEMYAQDDYTTLPVPVQTKVLAEIGIGVSGLENMAKTVESALARARWSISEILKRPEDIRGSIADILQNIASGNAPGKQDGYLCLMTASGSSCIDPERSGCIGCGYEIYTKTILYCLSKEYSRLLSKKDGDDLLEAARCTKLLKESVMPVITEILLSVKRLYPDVDLKSMLAATEMGAMLC